jgi:hypothetical protein
MVTNACNTHTVGEEHKGWDVTMATGASCVQQGKTVLTVLLALGIKHV